MREGVRDGREEEVGIKRKGKERGENGGQVDRKIEMNRD